MAKKKRSNKEFIDRIKQIRQYIKDSKDNKPCMDCKVIYPAHVLQYDHVNPENKRGNISDLIKLGLNLEVVKKEIAKCEIVCSNCHCIREHQRRKAKKDAKNESN